MTDKIQEELEKEIEKIDVKNHWAEYYWAEYSEGNGFCETCVKLWELKAKLSQHLATKQAMIKEFENTRKEVQWWLQRFVKDEYTIYQIKRHINKYFKQKLGELKT